MDLVESLSDKKSLKRTLLFFPIIHSQSEMGTLAHSIMRGTQKNTNPNFWQRKVDVITQFWLNIENIIFNDLSLEYSQTRVYQDGLPVCDNEEDIVADIAKTASPNFKILLRLKEKGATIMGTESASLLIEEYQHAKVISEASDGENVTTINQQDTISSLLLEKRDSFIAARIDQTLQAGETGILFLGLLHNPIVFLPTNITVLYPIGKPFGDQMINRGLNEKYPG